MKQKIVTVLVVLHIAVIYMGSCLFNFGALPHMAQAAASLYLSCVGGNGYAFFAVSDMKRVVARCYVLNQNNELTEENFGGGEDSYEFRRATLIHMLDMAQTPEVTARTAARYCFLIHPDAKSVRVTIGSFDVPGIKEYRAGKKYGFSEFYHRTYLNE